MLQIQNALGILSSQVPTGNLLWVDAVNGVDALASRGRLTIPFKTLTSAKNAAASGDTIVVLPGVYDEKNLLKDHVNWFFFPGAIVRYSGNANGGIFDTGANGTDSAVSSVIGGWGEFAIDPTNTNNSAYIVNSAAGGSALIIQAVNMYGRHAPCVKVGAGSGTLQVSVQHLLNCSNNDAVLIDGTAADNRIEADIIHCSGGAGVKVSSGGGFVKFRKIYATADHGVEIEGGNTVIEAYEITSQTSNGLHFNASTGSVTVMGARIVSLWNNASARAVKNETGLDDAVKLINCVLKVESAATYSLDAIGTGVRIHCLPAFVSSTARNTTSTALLTNVISIVDSTIS